MPVIPTLDNLSLRIIDDVIITNAGVIAKNGMVKDKGEILIALRKSM